MLSSGFLGSTLGCPHFVFHPAARGVLWIYPVPPQLQWSCFSLSPLGSSLPLWLPFLLLPCLLIISQHTGFPVNLQTSSSVPPLNLCNLLSQECFSPRRPWGNFFTSFKSLFFSEVFFGHCAIIATPALPNPPSCFIFFFISMIICLSLQDLSSTRARICVCFINWWIP